MVIVSLVVDESSKTEFAKKVNRMIVLLSRARLGLYILENTGYFESHGIPQHWAKTFSLLQNPAKCDLSNDNDNIQIISEAKQTGSQLPLCCPLHRHVRFSAKCYDDLKLGFCNEVCREKLSCGHECSLPCHWPKKDHCKQCNVEMDSPCNFHPGKVMCHVAFRNAHGAPHSTQDTRILQFYHCPIVESVALPCGHTINKPCHEKSMMMGGVKQMPPCNQPSTILYTFAASCGHTKPVTCAELELFNQNPLLVRCEESEVHNLLVDIQYL